MEGKRFVEDHSYLVSYGKHCILDKVWDKHLYLDEVIDSLNKQQATISDLKKDNEQLRKYNGQLKERLEKINGGYGHLTYRNGLTANEWLIESQERELKKKNEQISALKEENERLRNELDCFHPVMFQDMRKGTVVLYLKELK